MEEFKRFANRIQAGLRGEEEEVPVRSFNSVSGISPHKPGSSSSSGSSNAFLPYSSPDASGGPSSASHRYGSPNHHTKPSPNRYPPRQQNHPSSQQSSRYSQGSLPGSNMDASRVLPGGGVGGGDGWGNYGPGSSYHSSSSSSTSKPSLLMSPTPASPRTFSPSSSRLFTPPATATSMSGNTRTQSFSSSGSKMIGISGSPQRANSPARALGLGLSSLLAAPRAALGAIVGAASAAASDKGSERSPDASESDEEDDEDDEDEDDDDEEEEDDEDEEDEQEDEEDVEERMRRERKKRARARKKAEAARKVPDARSGFLGSFSARRPEGERAEMLDPKFYLESFDPVRVMLEQMPAEDVVLKKLGLKSGRKLLQLDVINEQLAKQVMSHHQEMVQGMTLVGELDRDLRVVSVICRNARRSLSLAMQEVSRDLVVASNVRRKRIVSAMLPQLLQLQRVVEVRARMDSCLQSGEFARALRLCSQCLVLIEEQSGMVALMDMNQRIEEWLTHAVDLVDAVAVKVCQRFDPRLFSKVIDAYAVMDDADALAEKVQNFFAQAVVGATYDALLVYLEDAAEADDSRRSRMAYTELCTHLPTSLFQPCLLRTLQALFDILGCYHTIMSCAMPPAIEQLPQAPSAGHKADKIKAVNKAKDGEGSQAAARGAAPGAQGIAATAAGEGAGAGDAAAVTAVGPAGSSSAGSSKQGSAVPSREQSTEDLPALGQQPGKGSSSTDLTDKQGGGVVTSRAGETGGEAKAGEEVQACEGAEGGVEVGSESQQRQQQKQEGQQQLANGSVPDLGGDSPASSATGAVQAYLGEREDFERQQVLGEVKDEEKEKDKRNAGDTASLQQGQASDEKQAKAADEKQAKAADEQQVNAADEKQAKAADEKQAKAADEQQAKAEDEKQAKEADEQQAKAADEKQAKEAGEKWAKEADEKQAKEADEKQAKAADAKQAKAADEKRAKAAAGAAMVAVWDPQLGDFPPAVARKLRVQTLNTLQKAMVKGRKAVWELGARRVSALLSAPASVEGSANQFLQCLEWVDKFASAGESFTESEAAGLRSKLLKQSDVFFKTFHKQNLKVLLTILERETWQRLPPTTINALQLAGLIDTSSSSSATSANHTSPPRLSTHSFTAAAPLSPSGDSSKALHGSENREGGGDGAKSPRLNVPSFSLWLNQGNPFASISTEGGAAGGGGPARADGDGIDAIDLDGGAGSHYGSTAQGGATALGGLSGSAASELLPNGPGSRIGTPGS